MKKTRWLNVGLMMMTILLRLAVCVFVATAFLSHFQSAEARPTLPGLGVCGLDAPTDLAVNDQGDVLYVADTGNHRVILLSQGFGCDAFAFGTEGDGEGEFNSPRGIAIDSMGRIYVADSGNNRLQRFESIAGKDPGDEIGFEGGVSGTNFSDPGGMGVDADDRIYVADTGNDRIVQFDTSGFVSDTFGESGDEEGQFQEPVDVAACRNDDEALQNRIYVVDRSREDVQVFDADGTFLFAFGRSGSDVGQFSNPSGIALDFQCNVYVADHGNDRVQMFDSSGAYLETIGSIFDINSVVISSFEGQGGAQGGVFTSSGNDNINRFVYVNYDTDGNGSIDNDGDGLPDIWEENGIDLTFDGSIELDLPAMGSDPNHKNIFVEVDFMEFHQLDETATTDVIAAFAQSPVSNPDGATGISLHIEMDDELTHQNVIDLWSDFNQLKEQNFGTAAQRSAANADAILAAKRLSHRYAMIIHTFDKPNTVASETGTGGIAELGGNDFILSLGNWDCNDPSDEDACTAPNHRTGTPQAQGYGFMHELGHTLNLTHGGLRPPDTNGNGQLDATEDDAHNCKPNHISIMSYSYVSLGIPDIDAFNPTGELVGRLDFSREQLPPLTEDALNEPDGIGDGDDYTVWSPDEGSTRVAGLGNEPLNWNGNNQIDPAVVDVNINNVGFSGCDSAERSQLRGHDDWSNLDYNFRDSHNFADGVQVAEDSPTEFTFEIAQQVRQMWRDVFGHKYTYSAKFICVPEVGPEKGTVSPGRYRTAINVHNPGNKEVRFLKKAVIARNENEKRGPISPLVEDALAGDEALSINCKSIADRFEDEVSVGDGFFVIKSNDPLDVAAVYTSRDSVDVEYIAPTVAEEKKQEPNGNGNGGGKKPRADLTLDLPERTRVHCQTGRQCIHSVQVAIENPSTVDVVDPFEVSINTDNGLAGSMMIPSLAAGQNQTFVMDLPPGSNCYNPNCTVKATVDAGNAIDETDETNNVAKREDQG